MPCFLPRELYGIIGWPLAQTLSPLVHNTGFQALGIPAVYIAWQLEPENLEAFINSMRVLEILGASVTIPHKIAILPYLDNISEQAALAGAVNTLSLRADGLYGENTDVAGFLEPIKDLQLGHMDILLIGGGGAAHAAAAGLKMRGCANVRVTSAGNRRQYDLARRFGFEPVAWEERYVRPAFLVINATPLGMTGKFEEQTPYDFSLAPKVDGGFAYDLVYNPLETIFLREAKHAGRCAITGVEMFYGQADAQFFIWTGKHLPETSRAALVKALGRD